MDGRHYALIAFSGLSFGVSVRFIKKANETDNATWCQTGMWYLGLSIAALVAALLIPGG